MPQVIFSVSEPRVLALAVLCCSITVYFFSLRNKTRDLRFLIGAFSCWTAYFALALCRESIFPLSEWFSIARVSAGLLGLILFIGFAYSFGGHSFERESRIALRLAVSIGGLSSAFLVFQLATNRRINWCAGSGAALLLFVWAEAVFIRRWIHAQTARERCPYRGFALVFMLSVAAVGVYFLRDIGACPIGLAPVLCNLLYLATLVFFTLVYVNNSPSPTTFRIKITGASLFTALAVLTVMWTALAPAVDGAIVSRDGGSVRPGTTEAVHDLAMRDMMNSPDTERQIIQRQVIKCNYCILGSTVFVLIFFPAFFNGSLVRPLNGLLRAVDRLDAGFRDVQVPVTSNDEIGRLTSSFNRLTRSLKSAEDDIQCYMESMELKIRERTAEIGRKSEENERLLLNILPVSIVDRLKCGEGRIADACSETTVMFADIVGFTDLSSRMPACELVELLSDLISEFDQLAEEHGVEKIKTIGDAYMAVAGLPTPRADHAQAAVCFSLAMMKAAANRKTVDGKPLQLRIGINSGPVVAGIIGTNKFAYDLWGDTVNTASRMESCGEPNRIQVTEATYRLLREEFKFESRGKIFVKGKDLMATYFLSGLDYSSRRNTDISLRSLTGLPNGMSFGGELDWSSATMPS